MISDPSLSEQELVECSEGLWLLILQVPCGIFDISFEVTLEQEVAGYVALLVGVFYVTIVGYGYGKASSHGVSVFIGCPELQGDTVSGGICGFMGLYLEVDFLLLVYPYLPFV
ncbi:hypothetical protein D9M68_708560 [compost metagenome]